MTGKVWGRSSLANRVTFFCFIPKKKERDTKIYEDCGEISPRTSGKPYPWLRPPPGGRGDENRTRNWWR